MQRLLFYKKVCKMSRTYLSQVRLIHTTMLAFLWATSVLLALVEAQGGSPDSSGPSDTEVGLMITSQVEVCKDDRSKKYWDTSKINVDRVSEDLTTVHGELELLQEYSDEYQVEILLMKSANGKKELIMTMNVDLCKELAEGENSDLWSLLKYMKLPTECPIAPGLYVIDHMVMETDGLPINSSNMGNYEAIMNFVKCKDADCKEKTFVACIKVDCAIEQV